ncbi:glutamine synthetase family protein [Corynebacterium liangguodongii]|uniref:Glutamine synthetase n=1 Tax=Corynebacterium liangguodongii TaxID=2079535 RepID=A0A2S0WF54_9CORY|nr:glutamine synthetase family protein [Corynebacterium liangguodongii]AWB84405.1 glutamine synthetase [Corynebacterium liangguodongii]PWB99895.1 glutamine synthetase [Corynebacterium liangguodongii]
MNSQQENVLQKVDEQDISFIRLWFTDIFGSLKTIMMSPAELEAAFDEGVGFDGSSIEGFSRISESDTLLRPDPSTYQPIPFDEEDGLQTARMFCDITMPDGDPLFADPRQVLRRQTQAAREAGFECHASPEIEFYVVKPGEPGVPPRPADFGGYFDQAKRNEAPKFRRRSIAALEYMGIVTEFSHHEASPGQQEIDLRHTDALTMADNVVTFKYIVKTTAEANGVHATFMPKPFPALDGSAMHTHFSLFEGDQNAFHDPDDEISLSKTGRQFIAGIIEHANEISAVTNQWVNSYKRLQFGSEAPTAATWGVSNRSALVRVPTYRLNKSESRRVEVRSLDSGCNPYLAFAVVLAAGLRGITEGYELDEPARDDVFSLTHRERRAMGYRDLPTSLDQALRRLEQSEFMAEVLGEQVFEFFLRSKWDEWHSYTSQITQWEIDNNLDL